MAAVALVSTGCSSSDGPEPASAPPQTTPPAASSAPDQTLAQKEYLAGIAAIDPGLVANDDRALSRAKDICADIAAGEFTGDKLNARVAERLSGGNAQITAAQAAKVIALAKKTVC